jgi:hypothetical protein
MYYKGFFILRDEEWIKLAFHSIIFLILVCFFCRLLMVKFQKTLLFQLLFLKLSGSLGLPKNSTLFRYSLRSLLFHVRCRAKFSLFRLLSCCSSYCYLSHFEFFKIVPNGEGLAKVGIKKY